MLSALKSFLIFAIIANIIYTSVAIKCYHCSQNDNVACDDVPDKKYLRDCDEMKGKIEYLADGPEIVSGASSCIKLKVSGDGKTNIIHSCDLQVKNQTICGLVGTELGSSSVNIDSCNECTTDKCNSASYVTPMLGAFMIVTGSARLV